MLYSPKRSKRIWGNKPHRQLLHTDGLIHCQGILRSHQGTEQNYACFTHTTVNSKTWMMRLNEGFSYAPTLIHCVLFTVQNETPAQQVPEVRLHTHTMHAALIWKVLFKACSVLRLMYDGVMSSSNPVWSNWLHSSSALKSRWSSLASANLVSPLRIPPGPSQMKATSSLACKCYYRHGDTSQTHTVWPQGAKTQ